MQGTTKIRFRKINGHESNQVSQFLKEEKSESDIQHIVCIVNEHYVDNVIFIICLFILLKEYFTGTKILVLIQLSAPHQCASGGCRR